jgi:hypothetical protein
VPLAQQIAPQAPQPAGEPDHSYDPALPSDALKEYQDLKIRSPMKMKVIICARESTSIRFPKQN